MSTSQPTNPDEVALVARIAEIRADREEAKARGAWNAASALHRSENQVLKELRLLRAEQAAKRETDADRPADGILVAQLVGALGELPDTAIAAVVDELARLGHVTRKGAKGPRG